MGVVAPRPERPAAYRAASRGRSQSACASTMTPGVTASSRWRGAVAALRPRNTAGTISTCPNVRNVWRPTSSATVRGNDFTRNLAGVARKDTPATIPAQIKARARVHSEPRSPRSIVAPPRSRRRILIRRTASFAPASPPRRRRSPAQNGHRPRRPASRPRPRSRPSAPRAWRRRGVPPWCAP